MQKPVHSPGSSRTRSSRGGAPASPEKALTWEDKHLAKLKLTEGLKGGDGRLGANEAQEKMTLQAPRSPILKSSPVSKRGARADAGSPPGSPTSPSLQPNEVRYFRQQSLKPTTHGSFTALEREVPHLSLAEMRKIYPERDRIIEELMVTLGKDGLWRKRRMLLTKDVLLFFCGDLDICLDSVPVQEIAEVVLAPKLDYDSEKGFIIRTVPRGFNGGDTFCCRAPTTASCQSWVMAIEDLSRSSGSRTHCWYAFRNGCRRTVESDAFRLFIVISISLNFALIIAEAQLVPQGTRNMQVFKWIDVGFTIAFVVELCICLVAYLPFEFWQDGWNICDFVIVILSFIQIIVTDLLEVQQLRLLRLFRVLRVLRLFGKLQHLRHIVSSITKAIVPVLYAMFIVLMVVSIYATIGVEIFRERSPEFSNFFRAVRVDVDIDAL